MTPPDRDRASGGAPDVRFVELDGPDARERLTAHATAWSAAGGDPPELLESVDQPGLLLLVLRGGGAPTDR